MLKTQLLFEDISYDGTQLAGHWIYQKTGILGDAIVSFCGPCDVHLEAMADLKDKMAGETIAAERMVHFLAEFFGRDLETTVLYQRALITVIKEVTNTLRAREAEHVSREGDDLYLTTERGRGKLSVSIATVSLTSGLVHAGVNVSQAGTPVATAGLIDLAIDEREFAAAVVGAFAAEIDGIDEARFKTRAVL